MAVKMWILAVFVAFLANFVNTETVYDALSRDPDLSQFFEMIDQNEVAKVYTKLRSATVFAATNAAMQRARPFRTEIEKRIAEYHVVGVAIKKEKFPIAYPSQLSEAAPLYMTIKTREGNRDTKEYYVNNALIFKEQEFPEKNQILYYVDEVLEPYIPPIDALPPNAYDFMNKPSVYNIAESVVSFAQRVRQEGQEELFRQTGNHTFFLPVGSSDGHDLARLRNVDQGVIRGHVIPNHVLFTRNFGGQQNYRSLSYGNGLKVELSIVNQSNALGTGYVLSAQSNTIQSDPRHRKGVVLSRIVRANIPLKNGVAHLIEAPLMIIDINIWDFIQNEKDARLQEFFQLMNFSPDFRYELQSPQEKTVFAPDNHAIQSLKGKLDVYKTNISAITNLLRLHLVMRSVSSDDVKAGRIREQLSADGRRSLYFRVVGTERNRMALTVEGGGVNATAVQADVGATNGIVHIIDKMLGMPHSTIFHKLMEDPQLWSTRNLSQQNKWIDQLAAEDRKFTFFVPSEQAWADLQQEMPTPYKQLFSGKYPYNVAKILDRHLLVNEELNMDKLRERRSLQMSKGVFQLETNYNDIEIIWEGERARIVRQDVQATNGIIHVINKVLMKPRDLTSSSSLASCSHVTLLAAFLLALLCTRI